MTCKLIVQRMESWCGKKYNPKIRGTNFSRSWSDVDCYYCLKFKYNPEKIKRVEQVKEELVEPNLYRLREYWRDKD